MVYKKLYIYLLLLRNSIWTYYVLILVLRNSTTNQYVLHAFLSWGKVTNHVFIIMHGQTRHFTTNRYHRTRG